MRRAAFQTAAGIGLGLAAAYLAGEAASRGVLIEPADGDETATGGSAVVADGGGQAPEESSDEHTPPAPARPSLDHSAIPALGQHSGGGRYRRRRSQW
jgi:hypothetical protein